MVDYCVNYMEDLNTTKKGKMIEDLVIDKHNETQAFVCPNAGASSNLASRKQRLIFKVIDRNDVYSILDVGKVADLMLMVMSCK